MARRFLAVLAFVPALALTACGSPPQGGSMIAPTAVPADVSPAQTASFQPTSVRPEESGVVEASTVITSLVSGTACPTLRFMVSSYTFLTSAETRYENGSCADLRAGSSITFAGTRNSDNQSVFRGSRITFPASTTTRPTTPTPTTTRPPETTVEEPVSGEGVVASLVRGTECPTLNFMIGPYTLHVSAATRFEGGTCADITPGLRVIVTGVRQGDGTLALSAIAFRIETPARQNEVEGEGAVTGVVGTTACPTLQVRIGEYTLNVDASTEYVTESCAGIAVGRTLGVRGVVVGEKTVRATRITFRN